MSDYPRPVPDQDSEPYWDGLRAGELRIQRCGGCGRAQHYFRAQCRHCWSRELAIEVASGRGTIHSYTVVHQAADPALAAETPYPLALVDIEEGPRLLARIDAAAGAVEIGAPVEAAFHDRGDWTILHFAPVEPAS
jgi:uncharacterized OB-fold protein